MLEKLTPNGRFPTGEIPALYTGKRLYDLAESTTKDLTLGDLIDLLGIDATRDISLAYTNAEGLTELRQEIGKRCQVPMEQVVTTEGAAFALYLIASELAAPGARVIIPTPFFDFTYHTLVGNRWEIDTVDLDFAQDFALDVDAIGRELNEQTRLVSLASPHNPSGRMIPHETIVALLALMERRAPDAYLLVDETYREAAYDGANVVPSAASLSPKVITCASMSKAYGIPGLRVGWVTTADSALRKRIITAKKMTVICTSGLLEALGTAVLRDGDELLARQRAHMAHGLALVASWQASERERMEWIQPEAGALCCVRLNPICFDDDAVARFWQAAADVDLLLRPGLKFGVSDRIMRLGFGSLPFELLEAGLESLSRAMDMAEAR